MDLSSHYERRLSRDLGFGGPLPGPAAVLTPSSASTATIPSPNASHRVRFERRDYADLDAEDAMNDDERARKKQKRNKPTLSCHECVERKTKVCDAG
jgi:hypothetical protein